MPTSPGLKNPDAKPHPQGDSMSTARRAVWFVLLSGGLAVTTPSSVSGAQSVTLAWSPVPYANVAGYKVYYGRASRNYTNGISVGNVTNATISGLTDGATYYFAITTLSTFGLESGYSSEVSYMVPNGIPYIQVTPTNSAYGNVLVGTSKTNSFTVRNAGTGILSGNATVASPFSIVSGGSYSLGAGQTQLVMVAFSPLVAGKYSNSVTFSPGVGTSVTVSGNVTNSLAPPSFTIITETVSASINNPIMLQYCTNLSSPIWWPLGTFVGSTNLSFTNMPAVFMRGVCSNLTGSITLTWPASTSPSTAGYKVYYGTSSGVYSWVINVGKVTTVTIPNLIEGQIYYFLVATYNNLGTTSPYLVETSATPPITPFSLSIGP
jgi:hypothetical protein